MASSRGSRSPMSIAKVTPLEMPLPDHSQAVPRSRKLRALLHQGRSRFHRFIKFRIVEANWFTVFIMTVIVINAIILALDTDKNLHAKWGKVLIYIDNFCLLIYIVEFVLKLYAEPVKYWKSAFNLFDFVIVVMSLLQIFVEFTSRKAGFQILRIFRIIRTIRIMRTVRFVRGLEVLIVALVQTLRQWIVSVLCLMVLLIYFAAIVGHSFFARDDSSNWGTLRACFISLASYVTTDGWYDRQYALENVGYFAGSRLFAIMVIWSLNFMFTNLFVAVILMNIDEATSKFDEEEAERKAKILRHKKEVMMRHQREDLKQLMQCQRKGNYLNFQQMVAEFQKTLKHEDVVVLTDLCSNIVWLETYILTMENMAHTLHSVQQFHFEMANILTKALELTLSNKYGVDSTSI